jgi:hypothetical protein
MMKSDNSVKDGRCNSMNPHNLLVIGCYCLLNSGRTNTVRSVMGECMDRIHQGSTICDRNFVALHCERQVNYMEVQEFRESCMCER